MTDQTQLQEELGEYKAPTLRETLDEEIRKDLKTNIFPRIRSRVAENYKGTTVIVNLSSLLRHESCFSPSIPYQQYLVKEFVREELGFEPLIQQEPNQVVLYVINPAFPTEIGEV